MGNEVTGLEEFTPMWGGGAAPIGIMPPQRAPDPMAVQPEVAPEDPVDYFSRKFPPQPDYVRDGYQYEQDAFVTAYGDQVNDHQFTNIEEYIDFVEGLTLPSGQPFPPEIDAFKRKFAMEFKQPAVGRDLAERQEARKAESRLDQGMDRNLRMQKKIDAYGAANIPGYKAGNMIYDAQSNSPVKAKADPLDIAKQKDDKEKRMRMRVLRDSILKLEAKRENDEDSMTQYDTNLLRVDMDEWNALSTSFQEDNQQGGGTPTREQALEELRRRGVM